MQFDYTQQLDHIDYAFVKAGHRIVFIKVGLGGNCSGSENKYLIMARELQEKYGCSVIVASNPNDGRSHVQADMQIIRQFIADNRICAPELLFFGNSNGCIKGLALTDAGIAFNKMVLVNMPLMINFHKTKQYISAVPQTKILAIYGDRDPSVTYIPFIEGKYENLKVHVVSGADHNFRGMLREFVDLSSILME